jgi:hypothetical protein
MPNVQYLLLHTRHVYSSLGMLYSRNNCMNFPLSANACTLIRGHTFMRMYKRIHLRECTQT